MGGVELLIAPATIGAARHAVTKWHYSETMPSGKLVRFGVWENERFAGVVLFGSGATPNLCRPYGLRPDQVCELVRVALRDHATEVSRIIRIALIELRKQSPGLELVVSFADPRQGHHGGIYQAGGWIYAGKSSSAKFGQVGDRLIHPRTLQAWKANGRRIDHIPLIEVPGKHRYLMPLTKWAKRKFADLAQPYPKRATTKGAATR